MGARVTRVPTEKQYATLRPLGAGAAGVAWLKSRAAPLVRRGWVTAEDYPGDARHTGFVRITPDGLRALAAAVERYGLPELGPAKVCVRVCANCDAEPLRQVCSKCGDSRYRYEARDPYGASPVRRERVA